MKPSWGLFLASLVCTASAAPRGHVFIYDPAAIKSKDTPQYTPVSPNTARLILAQRLGLSQYHDLRDADSETIGVLNQYGDWSQQLFSQDRESNQEHALIWLDGVEDPLDIIKKSDSMDFSQFTIPNIPPASANAKLVQDFETQAKALPVKLAAQWDSKFDTAIVTLLDSVNTNHHISTTYENLASEAKRQEYYRTAISTLLSKAKEFGLPLTIVTSPATASNSHNAHPYGTYNLPTRHLAARRQVPEAILSSSSPEASDAANASSETTPNIQPLAQDGPVLGILKTCYATQALCETSTRNCSSHGSCSLTRHGEQRAGGKGKYNDCYSCTCVPTIIQRGESKGQIKTTNWGGPACQKKDVVVEFWLFVAATVGLMFLVGTGIGMLYSMGEEELPSVIGAGVSGPARK